MGALIALIILFGTVIFLGLFTANKVLFKKINLEIKDWPEKKTRILFLSDLHTTGKEFRIKRVIKLAQKTPCDIVCITGDIISRRINIEKSVAKAIRKIASGRPTFLVWGNNDYNREIDRQLLYQRLSISNITILVNEVTNVGNLIIGGLGDPFWQKDDLDKTLNENVDLLLSHTPDPFLNIRQRAKLMLAGHTHGGQFCWVDGSPMLPKLRKENSFFYGLYYQNATYLYTTSGVGTTRLPLRYFCYPEIVLLEVSSK